MPKMEELLGDRNLEDLTEAELLSLMENAQKPDEGQKPSSEKHYTQEEVDQLVAERMQAAKPPEPVKTEKPSDPNQPQTPQPWDYDQFKEKFLRDPREALDYVDEAQYGMPVRKLVPVLMAGLTQLAKQQQESEKSRFLSSADDFEATPENSQVIEQILQERGWQPSYQAYEDALAIGVRQGRIKGKAKPPEKPPEPSVQPPPDLPPGGQSEVPDALLQNAENMEMDDLEKLLLKSGVITHGRN